jgi:zinc transporter ZupT
MNSNLILGLIPASIATLSILLGDVIKMNKEYKYMANNVAIGALFAVLSLELVPMMHKSPNMYSKLMSILGIIMAIICLYVLKKNTPENYTKNVKDITDKIYGYIPLCIGLFLDGLIIGLQKPRNSISGLPLILACALSIDNFFVGLSVGSGIGNNFKLLIFTSIILGLAVIGGTIAGISAIKILKDSLFLYTIISFGVTALIWETFQKLITESILLKDKVKDVVNPYPLFGLYIGFITVFVVSWAGK